MGRDQNGQESLLLLPRKRTDDEGKEVNCVVYLQGNCYRERGIRQEGEDDASRPL